MKNLKYIIAVALCMILAMFPVQASAASGVIKLNKSTVTLYTGQSCTLKATGYTGKVQWSSKNKNVAVVSSAGKVTAKKQGTTTITARAGNSTATCKITVKSAVASRNAAYCKVIKSLEKKYGKLKIVRESNIKYSTGVVYAALMDLNQDKKQELIVVYSTGRSFNTLNYKTRVYRYADGKAVLAGETGVQHSNGFGTWLEIDRYGGKKFICAGGPMTSELYELQSGGKLKIKYKFYADFDGHYYINGKSVNKDYYLKTVSRYENGRYTVNLIVYSSDKDKLTPMMKKFRQQIGYK